MRRGRKSRKKVSIHEVSDRSDSYANLPAGALVAPIEVDDPNSKPGQTDKLIVMRMIRDDPLGEMHAKAIIDDAQFLAGRKWQACYERVALGSLRAGALSDFVSGGRGDAFSEARAEAALSLKDAAELLGKVADMIVHDVLGHGLSIRSVARIRGSNGGGQDRFNISQILLNSLETLVVFFKLGTADAPGRKLIDESLRKPQMAA